MTAANISRAPMGAVHGCIGAIDFLCLFAAHGWIARAAFQTSNGLNLTPFGRTPLRNGKRNHSAVIDTDDPAFHAALAAMMRAATVAPFVMPPNLPVVREYLLGLQDSIC